MDETSPTQALRRLIQPLVESFGLLLWGIEFQPAVKRSALRIFVDAPQGHARPEGDSSPRESGVSLDECAELSRSIGLALEVEDGDRLIPGAYVLEVSSPGFERTFFEPAQLDAYVGKEIAVTLRQPLSSDAPDTVGRKNFTGALRARQGRDFSLDCDGEVFGFSFGATKKVKLVHRFPEPGPGKASRRPGRETHRPDAASREKSRKD